MSKTLPNFLDTAYGEKILPMRTLSQLSPSRSSGLLGTWLGEKLSPSLSVSPPLIWPTWWSQVEISHFYISQTISCYLSQIIDDSGHRHVQKAHVAKKITKEEWDLVSCSAARCRCVTASSPSRLNISKASPTKSRIRCCPVVGWKCNTWCVPSKAVTLHCPGNITTLEVYQKSLSCILISLAKVESWSLSSFLGFFLCELQDKSKITDHKTARQSFVKQVYL